MAVDKQVPASPINYAQLKAAIDEEFAKLYNRAPVLLQNVSGTDSITAETDPSTTALVAGNSFWLIPANTNTGPADLSINGLTAFDLLTQEGEALGAGSLIANGRYLVFYDGQDGIINFGGDQGPPGVAGEDGEDGQDALDPGLLYHFTGVSGIPESGELALNDSDLTAVTEIDINPVDAFGGDVNDYIETWDDIDNSLRRGTILIRDRSSSGIFAFYDVTGSIINNSTHLTVPVTHIASTVGGVFTGNVSVQFTPSGQDGELSGPASSTDSAFALWDGTTGNLLKDGPSTIAVSRGGTGATAASGARTNLGLAIGSDVQAFSSILNALAALSDPDQDTIVFWDEHKNDFGFLTLTPAFEIINGELRYYESLIIAISDETTDLETGLKLTMRMPYRFELTEVRGSLTQQPDGSDLVMDIHQDGQSIFGDDKITIADGTDASVFSGTVQPDIVDAVLEDNSEIEIYIDQVGSTSAGKGAKVYLIGFRPIAPEV